ncbi:MAG TPA: efflux transporter outer membrane subunit [Vicinamibacterales bacterium]|nr:efflux transporter outer membrane subunit [Vicinamibacterales bacterium]
MARTLLGLLFTAAAVSGCSLRGPYKAPQTAPAVLHQQDTTYFDTQPYDPAWWTEFDDPVLDRLVRTSLDANLDVRAAVARLDQARAVFDDVKLDRYPTVTVGASVDRREQAVPGFSQEPIDTTTYRAGFDAFWEVDLFGRVRSAVRAAGANAQGFAAALEDVRVSVAAEVARNYFELRGLQQQIAVTERSLTNARETLRLTEVRRDAGFGEEQDVASARARVAAVESLLPPIAAAVAEREHRLAVLNGVRPGELNADLSPRDYPVLAKALPLGDVGALLRRRPDVRAAERRLAAATANEGVAAADLFPRITISGVLGFLAGRGSLFGTSDSRAWAVTPALSWAAFDLGSARARLRGAEATTREAVADYEHTVLRALEEAENALSTYREQQRRLVSLADQARESNRAASIARVRYREGVADFLSLLDAERTQLQAEDAVAQAEAGAFTTVVAVYKALGGITEAPAPAAP